MTISISERLTLLRTAMQKVGVDYFFVPSSDQHNSEYLPACWERRKWISGFTGSAGDVLVGINKAYLWTDPRYFLQAEKELEAQEYTLMKQAVQGMAPPIDQWLKANAKGKVLGLDPKVVNIAQANKFEQAMSGTGGKVVNLAENLIDQVWSDQPTLGGEPISIYPEALAGVSAKDKIKQVQQSLTEHSADALVVSMLDEIAWLYNIRGTDIDYNPLVISYAVVSKQQAHFFVGADKLNDKTKSYFAAQNIQLHSYAAMGGYLKALKGIALCDPATVSSWVAGKLNKKHLILAPSPIQLLKACKNPTELDGAKVAHERDAVAEVKFIHWLTNNWQEQDELSAEAKLEAFRAEGNNFRGLSFNTISGYGANGAIVHYRSTRATAKKINNDSLYLCDSGGQYLEGTTDITRVMHFGTPTADQKRHYTLVLKGHLALRHAVFPLGTCGEHLDALARQFLWQDGINYGHGTGHGVGAHLCVHEGPQRISAGLSGQPLRAGMIVSNEPGIYFTGKYGIRIENLCVIEEKYKVGESATDPSIPYLGLRDLTMVPYERKLIDKNLLSEQELNQVNDYHQQVYAVLKTKLSGDVLAWMTAATAII